MKFAIITYILHKKYKNGYYSYEPYIREMNFWVKSAKELIVVAPKIQTHPGTIETAYQHRNISFKNIPVISFLNISDVLRSLFFLPWISFRIWRAMVRANHIHLRCPGNIGLISCFIQILFPKKPKTVKYAGNWDPQSRQPWSYNLQKWILSNSFLSRNIKVLVYGEWQDQPKNIIPFFTASFSQIEKVLNNKIYTQPYKFIFVGSLSEGKRPLFAIQLMERLMKKSIAVKLEIYGSGVLKNGLQDYISTKNLDPYVSLMGSRKLEELKDVYIASHFLILASTSEGWPKAVAEAMFFGCIPIATGVSCVPWMLNYGTRGILIPDIVNRKENTHERYKGVVSGQRTETSDNVLEDTVDRVIKLINDPEEIRGMSMEAQEWSQEYTLEKFEEEINKVLKV